MPKATHPASPPPPEGPRGPRAPRGPSDPVAVGRVVGAWGVRGWIRVVPFNDSRQSILSGLRRWWLEDRQAHRALEIEQARAHGQEIVAKVEGIDDRDAAAALEGRDIFVARTDFPAPSDEEVYWVDLIGCTVRNPAGEALGVVQRVEDHSAHPVLRLSDAPVDGEPAADRLIPLVPEVVLSIDVAARIIVADWQRDY